MCIERERTYSAFILTRYGVSGAMMIPILSSKNSSLAESITRKAVGFVGCLALTINVPDIHTTKWCKCASLTIFVHPSNLVVVLICY